MLLFTQYGLFGAVCAREGDRSWAKPVDVDRVMVRARFLEHLLLEILFYRERFESGFRPERIGGIKLTKYYYKTN